MGRRRKAEVIGAQMLSPSVRSLSMRTLDGSAIGHVAGQYLDVIVPTARGVAYKRPYSIASPPSLAQPDECEIAVTRVDGGPTSEALHEASLGAIVEIEGPTGNFVRRESERAHPGLFIATGTGLAPIRAMLAEEVRLAEVDRPPMVLLFGCRTTADVLWGDELRQWEQTCPRYAFHVTLSRAAPDWTGLVGYVQRHARGLADALPGVHAYVCGISAMVDEVMRVLERDARLPRDALHYEPYD
jgi:ferredoxin-NADP reductase